MIEAGTYEARPITAALGQTKGDKPCVGVEFELDTGAHISWFGYFTEKTTERTIESEVDKRVKAKSGTVPVPGTTSAPATNNNIRFFQRRGTAAEGGGQTNAQKAAELLDRRAAARQAEAS